MEQWQKAFVTLSRFWLLKGWGWGWGWGVWVKPLKKETLWRKSFFQVMLNEVLKSCEKWYLLMLKLKKQEIKDLVTVFYKLLWEVPSKLEARYFPLGTGFFWGFFLLNRQNPWSVMTKVICRHSPLKLETNKFFYHQS